MYTDFNNPYYSSQLAAFRAQPQANIQQINNPAPNATDARMTAKGMGGGGGGIDAGGAANIVGGAIGLAGDAMGMANQRLNLQTNYAPTQTDQDSAPVYTGGQVMIDAANARPQGATGGEILKSAGSGAAAGSVAGPWGAAVGAVVGAGAALIGGGARKRRQRREKNRALGQANKAASEFNSADMMFRQRQAGLEDYTQKTNSASRMANLYRSQY
jgi:hypothetical protein